MKNNKRQCELLWAKNKYLVLSKSQNIYKEIREYLKNDNLEIEYLEKMIERAISLEENPREVVNCLNHIWGYFKDKVKIDEREEFFRFLKDYENFNISKDEVLKYLFDLLKKYPNEYLENSNIW